MTKSFKKLSLLLAIVIPLTAAGDDDYLTIGGERVMNGPVSLSCIKKGNVSYGEEYGVLLLDHAEIETDGSGIYMPEGMSIVLIGANYIKSVGHGLTIADGDATISGQGSLYIKSSGGYGISMADMLEVYDSNGSPTLSITGKYGALDGRERWSNYYQEYRYGYLSAPDAEITLRSNGKNPVVHKLGSIETFKNTYTYDYEFSETKHTVVDAMTDEPITRNEIKIVPKSKIEYYNIWMGGNQMNNYNSDSFTPQSLTAGNVWYDTKTNTLTLNYAKFKYPYWSAEDCYALYALMNDLTIRVVGDNDLAGTADGYDYGIWLEQKGNNRCNWTIRSDDGSKLNINGDIYMTNNNPNSKLTIENVDITCNDYCHLWCEDDVNVEIINSSLDLWDKEYGQTEKFSWYLMGMMETLTLTDCHFENSCYWNPTRWMVFNTKGKPETYHLKIDRGEPTYKYGDVNTDGEINTGDVTAVYSFIINGTNSGFTRDNANVNGDNEVNTADVTAIYNIIIKGN